VTRARRRLAMLLVAAAEGAAEKRLVAKYSPFVMLREQNDPPCDNKEEQLSAFLNLARTVHRGR
jgi:hypothetical protein